MNKTERDRLLREIAIELKRIRDIPIRAVPDDAVHQLITARNFLRSVRPPDSGD